jgi:hypothetical protein
LRVAEVKVGFDGLRENAEDLAVEEIEDVGEKQKGEDRAGARLPRACCALAQKCTPNDTNTCRGGP